MYLSMLCKSEPGKIPELFRRFGRLSRRSLLVATSDSKSTISLCECKIATTFLCHTELKPGFNSFFQRKRPSGVALKVTVLNNVFIKGIRY